MRLGQVLLRMGLVSLEQLEEATERQVSCGGRLGSNLLELGYLSEEALAKTLSIIHGVPYADPARLERIDPRILLLISADFATKQKWTQEALKLAEDKYALEIPIVTSMNYAVAKQNVHDHGYLSTPNSMLWTPEAAWLAKR